MYSRVYALPILTCGYVCQAERALLSDRLDPRRRADLLNTVEQLRWQLGRPGGPRMSPQQNWNAPPAEQGWGGGGGGGSGGGVGYGQPPSQAFGYGGAGSPRARPAPRAGPGPTDFRRRLGPGQGDPRQRPAPLDMQRGGAVYNAPTDPAPVAQSPGSIFNSLFELGLIGGGATAAVGTGAGGLGAVLENVAPAAQAPVVRQPQQPQQPSQPQPQPQRAPLQQRTPYSQSAASAVRCPEIKLVFSELTKRHPGVIAALHPKGSMQCTTCGLRFPGSSKHEYQEHLDWHFRSNQEKNDTTKARSRHWFVSMHEWVHYTDDMSREERSKSDVFGDAAPQEADAAADMSAVSPNPTTPLFPGPTVLSCPVCLRFQRPFVPLDC